MVTTNKFVEQSDFARIFYLPANFDYDRVMVPCVLEAQQFDLRKAIGQEFYDNEVSMILDNEGAADVANLTVSAYNAIYNYIRHAVLYYAYARYLLVQDEHVTRTGVVSKVNQYSEPISEKRITRRVNEQREKATAYIRDMINYMEDRPTEYATFLRYQGVTGKETAVTFWTLKDEPTETGRRGADTGNDLGGIGQFIVS